LTAVNQSTTLEKFRQARGKLKIGDDGTQSPSSRCPSRATNRSSCDTSRAFTPKRLSCTTMPSEQLLERMVELSLRTEEHL